MSLEIIQKESHGISILALKGRLVLGQESMDFRGKVREVLDHSDFYKERWGWAARIVLDCGELGFVDSAGLGALVRLKLSAVIESGVSVKFVQMAPRVMQLLRLSNLVEWFSS